VREFKRENSRGIAEVNSVIDSVIDSVIGSETVKFGSELCGYVVEKYAPQHIGVVELIYYF
jgi:hypothetical protein